MFVLPQSQTNTFKLQFTKRIIRNGFSMQSMPTLTHYPETLWKDLEDTISCTNKPWLVLGDFNDYANQNERMSFLPIQTQNRTQRFNERVNNCNLIDLGSVGPRFTWTNNRQGMANIMERLDRAMSNDQWQALFPEAAWLCHPTFFDVVHKSWHDMEFKLLEAIDNFTINAKTWNKEVFGNIFKKKEKSLARIEGIQKTQAINFSHNLHLLEKDLIKQFNMTLFQEEILRYQKSNKWLTMGDSNSKKFHISTLTKRRKSKIQVLKDDNGNWISSSNDLKAHILDHFTKLFQYEETHLLDNWVNIARTRITKEVNASLQALVINIEIWDAICSIKAFKAPVKDGLQVVFYHNNWNTIGNSVCHFIKDCFHNKTVLAEINETQIVLISKLQNPESLKQFRLISLCNVTCKSITKIIVNRLRPLLSNLISPNQSSFIPGRTTTDNIIITQEILHTIRGKKGKD
ncbi:uncharacterized protein LOC114314661 [Camellia sinensis]|uniref:uncharacterized protein LOC114314661 n=1 Tax=Camellia sinensis TaxID=4442 RepID=UPI001035E9EF|nr:uncharacterized protein LOC114314661 [Camellia sinensis]